MKMSMNRCLALAVPVSLILIVSGCGSNPSSGEEYSAIGGTMSKVLEAPFLRVLAVTKTSMSKLGLKPMELERDGFRATIAGEIIEGMLSQTHEMRVFLKRESDTATMVELRIRGRGDEKSLKTLLDEIEKGIRD